MHIRTRAFIPAAVTVILLVLAGCTDLRVSVRAADPAFRLATSGSFRFARAPLAGVAGASESAVAADAAARSAISRVLESRGLHAAGPGDGSIVVVDFTLRDGIATNAPGPDGPSDYRRSWRRWRTGGAPDGSGAMDHTIADTAFRRVLALSVMLRPQAAPVVAWEGLVSRSVAPDYPDDALDQVLGRMCARLFDTLR